MDGAGWLSSLLTATSRYHPTRTSSARPRAAFSSLMFMRTDSAAWAWRASMQTTGRPVRLSSCQSQLDIAPVSRPTRSALGAFLATTAARTPGSDFTRPRSEEHTSELQSLMRISYAVFCLKKKNKHKQKHEH